MLFRDRIEADEKLAQKLKSYANRPDILVLGLPRGGVPVAFKVATILNAPLDVFLVRKLGIPGREEFAMGAIISGGVRILNREVIERHHISTKAIARAAVEQRELPHREYTYRGNRPPLDLSDRTVILVDDGIATGATMRAAAIAVKQKHPQRLVAAVPVSPPEVCNEFQVEDEIICGSIPRLFQSVGQYKLRSQRSLRIYLSFI